MKEIIATERIFNPKGYTIAIKYIYSDQSYTLKKVFIPPKKKDKKDV